MFMPIDGIHVERCIVVRAFYGQHVMDSFFCLFGYKPPHRYGEVFFILVAENDDIVVLVRVLSAVFSKLRAAGFMVRFDVRIVGGCILAFDRQTVCHYC